MKVVVNTARRSYAGNNCLYCFYFLPKRGAHRARNPNYSYARPTGDCCGPVVGLTLTEAHRIAVNIAKLPELFAKGWIRCAPLARILGPFRRQLDHVVLTRRFPQSWTASGAQNRQAWGPPAALLFEWPSMRKLCRRYYSGARDPPGRVAGEFSVFPVAEF